MKKFNIFVCENFVPEFDKVVENEGFDDVIIKSYPCMCENQSKKDKTAKLLEECIANNDDILLHCSSNCDIIKLIPKSESFKICSSNYCFFHLANEQFINYILQKGGYVISSGWLNNWREHIKTAGFDRDTAISFYKEFCKELVFFDAGFNSEAEKELVELSEFLELPYVIIPFEIEAIQVFVKSCVYEWRLQQKNKECTKAISNFQAQCAEYSAILDLIGKISAYTNKRDTIDKIKQIFSLVLGAQHFKYWNSGNVSKLPVEIEDLFSNSEKSYIFLKDENRFCIKIQKKGKIYGAIDVGAFLFPQYIEKYLNFAIEIANVCGLVLSNIDQYEKLIKSEKKLKYLSFHDPLTGLYNRTYINEEFNLSKNGKKLAIFIFDIDKLKYVNDNFGHLEGDKLICGVSDVLKKCFRDTDTIARIGGDEFLAILPDCDMEMAEIFRNRINETIIKNNKNKGLDVSISIGFSVAEKDDDTIENLMRKADEIMYTNKKRKIKFM